MPDDSRPRAIPPDYDRHPDRFRLARSVQRLHGLAPDVHERVAPRFVDEGLTPVLDVGCGEGELARHLPARGWVGVDASVEMLAQAPEPHYQADSTALPFPDGSFSSVALLYVLYHLPDPALALAEALRVLRSGGLVAVAAPSRHDSPELASALPRVPPTTRLGQSSSPSNSRGRGRALGRGAARTTDPVAVRDYLIGKGVEPVPAGSKAETVPAPLSVTKRGALAFARKR